MSLLDAFKPKWQNSNPERRIEAVEEMGPSNQDTFERIALYDEDHRVRTAAVKKLTVISALAQISKNDPEASVRRLAETHYFEELVRKLKEHRATASPEILRYIDELKDTRYAEDLIKNLPSSELRLEIVKKTSKANLLAIAACKDPIEEVAMAAVQKLSSETLLQDVAKSSKHTSVRKTASDKIKAQQEAQDGGKKAAALLISKREALIQQAHHLAAQKDPIPYKEQFAKLMEEARALGMGPAQATLDEIYASFNKFCDEADAARIAAKKAEVEKQALVLHLESTLAELEALVSENRVQESEERVDQIVTEWNENKGKMSPDAIRKFNQVFFKVQDLKKKNSTIEQSETEPKEYDRRNLLDQLSALADTETDESTSKHMHGIVREWEKLPLLEGEDPELQEYNSLRSKLGEKIAAFNASAQERFEKNSEKLKAIIERVKGFNENEDFKELSLKLRAAYQEWKDIVGEQKFKYRNLWLDYKAATERFQEMRQWQSWHNENDRASILEELELLAKEPASQEVLDKLKNLGTKWKNIGPISQAKFEEFRDRFQNLFEQIKQNCAPFIEERIAQRVKNLADKEGLCQKAEELMANAEIAWKDKVKAMQEIQDSWKAIGMVPKESLPALIERFKKVTGDFYAKHKELLKQEDKNREEHYAKKLALCEEAEALKDSTDWNATSSKLKQLQEAWKAIGPVPKSKSEEIWARFRSACDGFFEKKRGHFEEMDSAKQENLKKKESLCEKLEALDLSSISQELVDTVKGLEAEWKSIGMVPKEAIETINSRFANFVNQFMDKYAQVNEDIRKQVDEIKAKKQEMIEKVKQFAESAGSNQLADAVRDLQKEWRELGSCGLDEVSLQKNFREICDDFFNRRRDQLDIQEQARQNNLQKDLLTDLNEQTVGGAMNKVKHLRRLWKEVGAVPRSESDKVWKRFNSACDQVFAFGRKDEVKPEEQA